jgi:hypothetical protein
MRWRKKQTADESHLNSDSDGRVNLPSFCSAASRNRCAGRLDAFFQANSVMNLEADEAQRRQDFGPGVISFLGERSFPGLSFGNLTFQVFSGIGLFARLYFDASMDSAELAP